MKKNDFKTLAFALIAFVAAFSVAPVFAADAKTERVFCDRANRCYCSGYDCVGGTCCDGAGCVALTYPEPYDGSECVPNRITVQIGGPSPVPGWRPWRPGWRPVPPPPGPGWRPGWRPVPPPVPPQPPRPVHLEI